MSLQQYHPGRCLSIAVVARDDEAVLAETLCGVRAWADEVVVLDLRSGNATSGTAEIAKSLGARVVAAPWQHDYSAARNHLLARLSGHWVLWLEPGDRLDEASWPELRRMVDSEADRDTAYGLMVEVPPAEPSASAEQAVLVRLIPNRPELQFEGRTGETLKPSIERAGLKFAVGPGRIARHRRCHNAQWKSARAWETLDLVALESTGVVPSVRVLLAMGDAASDLKDWPLARQAYSEVVRTASRRSLEMLQGYYGILASFEGQSSDAKRQLAVCLEALEVFPLDKQLLCAIGTYLQAQDRLDLAIRTFQTAVDHGQIHLETWHLADIDEVAVVYLAVTLQLGGEQERARTVLEEGLARWPGSKRLRRQLVDLHIKHGRAEEAVAAAEGWGLDRSLGEPLSNAIRGACLAACQQWTPALAYLQSAYLAGCEDPICLRWLSVVLLSTGQVAAADPVLRRWESLEPNNAEVRAYLEASRGQSDSGVAAREGPSSGEWYRVDLPTTSIDIVSKPVPIVSQFSSRDT